MASRRGKKISTDMARAWLSTIIAPMRNAVEVERLRVAERDWSFRAHRRELEFLWPTRRMIAMLYLPNLDQLRRLDSSFAASCDGHDGSRQDLLTRCIEAVPGIYESSAFEALAPRGGEGIGPPELLAEYVINGVQELPEHLELSTKWGELGPRFLALREERSLKVFFQAIDEAGDRFGKAADVLGARLQELQQELADAHGLPPVDPAIYP